MDKIRFTVLGNVVHPFLRYPKDNDLQGIGDVTFFESLFQLDFNPGINRLVPPAEPGKGSQETQVVQESMAADPAAFSDILRCLLESQGGWCLKTPSDD